MEGLIATLRHDLSTYLFRVKVFRQRISRLEKDLQALKEENK